MTNDRIIFLIPSMTTGGSEKSLVKLVNILSENSCAEIVIITIKQCTNEMIKAFPIQIKNDIKIYSLDVNSIRNILGWFKLIFLMRKMPSRILCCWSNTPSVLGLGLRRFLRTSSVFISIRDIYKEDNFYQKIIRNYLFNKADVVTANSKENLKIIKSFLKTNKIKYNLLKNTIDIGKVEDLAKQDNVNLIKLSHRKNNLRILAVGRLTYQKGFDVLIKSLDYIPMEIDYTISIVGNGPLLENLKHLCKMNGVSEKINWLGEVKNPYPYYKNFDLLVFPSRHEGFPNVLLEALVIGIPIISSNCLTGPKELLNNGSFGQLIPTNNPKSLANAIINYYKQPDYYNKLALSGKKFTISNFNNEIVKKEYLKLFKLNNE